jgi:enoyl-CoA hydratase/carnithine racemase
METQTATPRAHVGAFIVEDLTAPPRPRRMPRKSPLEESILDRRIIAERDGAVQRIVFNRPDKKNALDRAMYLAIIAALREAEADASLRAVLFAGAGGAFTAGNDLNDFFEAPRPGEEFPALGFVRALAAFSKPMVAAVAGEAVGVGTTMLFHCDLVYAAPSARFKMPFVDLGLVPEAGVSLLAPALFGQAKAAQYLLLCESFDAPEALRLNLVNAVTDDPLARALDAARQLSQKPAEAIAASRRLLRGDPALLLERIDEEARLFEKALATPALRVRLKAFFAGRRE